MKARDDNDVFFVEAICCDGWTEEQVQLFCDLQEHGYIDERGALTSKGKAQMLGTLGNPTIPESLT